MRTKEDIKEDIIVATYSGWKNVHRESEHNTLISGCRPLDNNMWGVPCYGEDEHIGEIRSVIINQLSRHNQERWLNILVNDVLTSELTEQQCDLMEATEITLRTVLANARQMRKALVILLENM